MTDISELRNKLRQGNYRDALSDCETLLANPVEVEPADEIRVLKIDALTGLGRWAQAASSGDALLATLRERNIGLAGRIHGLLGFAFIRLGDFPRAELHLRASIHVYTWDSPDVVAAIRQRRRLGLLYLGKGLLRQASAEIEGAIAMADTHSAYDEAGILRVNLAATQIKLGILSSCARRLDEADELLERTDRIKWKMLSTLVRANLLRVSGRARESIETLQAALDKARIQQYSREEAIAMEYLGDCHAAECELDKAMELYTAAITIAEATAPNGDLIPELCHRIGEVFVRLGEPNRAIVTCERGLRAARAIGDRYEESATHRVLALAHKSAGNQSKGLRIGDLGAEIAREHEFQIELGQTLTWLGEVRSESPVPEERLVGRRQLWEARGIFERIGLISAARALEATLGFDNLENSTDDEETCLHEVSGADRSALRFGIITSSPEITAAVGVIQSIAPSQIPVLITGESGVGKELLAQALHQMSPRRKRAFIPINCAAVSVNLLDSEFFGHERGAFTGAVSAREGLVASSDKGTLFLDEVGDLPLQVQAALLRVLETGEVRAVGRDDVRTVDIRIVAATNAQLEDLVSRGQFRQDLFYRLNGIRINVPPLRNREEDIGLLLRHFWSQLTSSARKRLKLDNTVTSFLCAYHWPGNVRELRHEIARVVALAPDGSTVGPDAFLPQLNRRDVGSLRRGRDQMEEVSGERHQILMALRAHRGNKAEAARSLGGMKRTTLIYKIERLGIRPEEYQVRD